MANAINLWVLERLGIIFSNFSQDFNGMTKDGYLLAQILRSYEIINPEQLELIKLAEDTDTCFENFLFLKQWLKTIHIHLEDSEIAEIVEGRGTASLNLFYKVYLEVHDNKSVNYIAQERLNEKLRPDTTTFKIKKVEEPEVPFKTYENKFNRVIEHGYDVLHWHQDRLNLMIKKCQSIREEHSSDLKRRRLSSSFSTDFTPFNNAFEKSVVGGRDTERSINMSYDDLFQEQRCVKQMVPFVPNLEESMKILKNIRIRQQKQSTEAVLRRQLHKQVLYDFFQHIRNDEKEDFRNIITEKLTKQSFYEKQMIQKLGEVKMQRELMLENKQKIADAIAKEKEQEFVELLLQQDKELNEKELLYYLDKERALQLHKRIYEEKLRQRAEKNRIMCKEIAKDLRDLAIKEAEYKQFYGEEPKRTIRNQWKKAFIAGQSIDDFVVPVEDIVKEPGLDEEFEEIVEQEITRQDAIDQQDFENYLNFRWPWELANIEISLDDIYEMNCGLNVLSNIVYRILDTKYPLPPTYPPPNLPELEAAAFVNGLNELNCIPLLQKLLEQRQIIVCEIEDGLNFCINSFQEEIKPEDDTDAVEIEEEEKPQKKGKKEKPPRKNKGEKGKSDKKSKSMETKSGVEENVILKVNKKAQTPKVYPCEEVPLSHKAELGKLAEEQLSAGLTLTSHLMIAMFVEFLQSKKDMKGRYTSIFVFKI